MSTKTKNKIVNEIFELLTNRNLSVQNALDILLTVRLKVKTDTKVGQD